MREYGMKWGNALDPAINPDLDYRLASEYYDAQWVYFQISDYFGETQPWLDYAQLAEKVYRDEYLTPNKFAASGYRRFPHGLYQDFRRRGDTTLAQVEAVRDNPAYSRVAEYTQQSTGSYPGNNEYLSREVAYALQSNVIAERAGSSRVIDEGKPRVDWLLQFSENHLWEWRTQTFGNPELGRFSPFMFGLTAMALVEFVEWEEENGRDPNAAWPRKHWNSIEAALTDLATWLLLEARVQGGALSGQKMWASESFPEGEFPALRYQDRYNEEGGPTLAADLNPLVAPVYSWLYMRTGNKVFRDAGDGLFAGGVAKDGASFSGKHFNQAYRHSIRMVDWRANGDAKYCKVGPKSPTEFRVN